jgi:predicted P-loop ATPase
MKSSDDIIQEAKQRAVAVQSDLDIKMRGGETIVLPTPRNATIYLKTDPDLTGLFQYNAFANTCEVAHRPAWGELGDYPRQVNDHDVIHVRILLAEKYDVDFPKQTVDDAITFTATNNPYDPVLNYLTSIKWDGEHRLKNWLVSYLGVEKSYYSQFIGQMTLVAACARVDKPGIKFDHMLILEGAQAVGKSRAVEILGGEWSQEISLTERDKDTVERMQGCWIIEVPELSVFKKRDVESLKAFLTQRQDKQRLPWGRRSAVFPRRSIFIGTINPSAGGYLGDATGNRRFLPVRCWRINHAALMRDRDQLWAEAWHAYRHGFPLYLDERADEEAKQHQENRQTTDEWLTPIKHYVRDKDQVSSVELYEEALGGSKQDLRRSDQMRIAECLTHLKWTRKIFRQNKMVVRGFVPTKEAIRLREKEKNMFDLNVEAEWDEETPIHTGPQTLFTGHAEEPDSSSEEPADDNHEEPADHSHEEPADHSHGEPDKSSKLQKKPGMPADDDDPDKVDASDIDTLID